VGILCLGEAIVDLVCERPLRDISEAEGFVPHCGGAIANAAIVAARGGAEVALAGGVGDDGWGRWLERRLASEGVDLRWFSRVPGLATPVAFVTVDERGEPSFLVYGDSIEAGIESLRGRLEAALSACEAVLFGSNTLIGPGERELTLAARRLAREEGKPVLLDVNLRLHRWPSITAAVEVVREASEGAFAVKAN
jgi:sugar/nucleoside kinase (ribokinase family)